ncbi:unnamed protein product, partial [marine sediment metagenome]
MKNNFHFLTNKIFVILKIIINIIFKKSPTKALLRTIGLKKEQFIMKITVSGPTQSGKSSFIKHFDEKAMNVEAKARDNKYYT